MIATPCFAAGNNENTLLLLHCDGADASQTFTDASVGGAHGNATAQVTAQVDTAQKKFGTGSLLVDGDSDYLQYADDADWDITGIWSIDFWVKMADHTGTEAWINHFEDSSNYWNCYHTDGGGINFGQWENPVWTGVGPAGEIVDTNWHWILIYRTAGGEWGIYKDGSQVAYLNDATIGDFSGTLNIGARGDPKDYFDGWMDEICLRQGENYHGATPANDNSDTVDVPDEAYSADTSAGAVISIYQLL